MTEARPYGASVEDMTHDMALFKDLKQRLKNGAFCVIPITGNQSIDGIVFQDGKDPSIILVESKSAGGSLSKVGKHICELVKGGKFTVRFEIIRYTP